MMWLVKQMGFSVMELLIALMMLCMLFSAGFYFYSHHIAKAKRFRAASVLLQSAMALEQYRIREQTYQDASLENLSVRETTPDYQIMMTSTASDYLLKATPLGKQAANDAECAVLMLTSRGEKLISGTGNAMDCWS